MIDHLVLATPDVAGTAAALSREWGLDLSPGGSHVGLGTRNELTGLGGTTYLEVVGPDDGQPEPAGPRPFGIDDLVAPALVAWCARPAAPLDDVIAAAADLGVHLGDATGMSRRRPDGVLLEWRLTFPLLGPPHLGTVPFLIDWQASPHPTASLPHECRLEALRLTHPRPDALRAIVALLGDDARVSVAEGPASLSAEVRTPAGLRAL